MPPGREAVERAAERPLVAAVLRQPGDELGPEPVAADRDEAVARGAGGAAAAGAGVASARFPSFLPLPGGAGVNGVSSRAGMARSLGERPVHNQMARRVCRWLTGWRVARARGCRSTGEIDLSFRPCDGELSREQSPGPNGSRARLRCGARSAFANQRLSPGDPACTNARIASLAVVLLIAALLPFKSLPRTSRN